MSSVDACSIESLLGALERAGAASADPATALRDAVGALWAIAEASGIPRRRTGTREVPP